MSDDPNDQPEKKIIIDEDWKSQVQAEKEALKQKQEEQETSTPAEPGQAEPDAPLPPPSLEILASTLGMQAMIAMGHIPHPATGKPERHLNQAKHFIETIAMLEEKTEGNRTPDETAAIGNLLHELRMGYLAVKQGQAES